MPRAKTTKETKKPTRSKKIEESALEIERDPIEAEKNSRGFFSGKRRFWVLGLVGLGLLLFLVYKVLIIAIVDGKPVTKLEMYKQLEERYGTELKDQLITENLVMAEARKRKVSVSDDEVKSEISKIEEQQGGKEQLDQLLQIQGFSRVELEKQIKLQTLVKKMFDDKGEVNDEEVNKYIEENKAQLPDIKTQSASEAAKLKQDVKEQLKQQKVGQAFNEWLNQAKNSGRVIRI